MGLGSHGSAYVISPTVRLRCDVMFSCVVPRNNEAINVITLKIDTEAFSKTHDGTSATLNRAKKFKVFRDAAREGLEDQAKKMKATAFKEFQKYAVGQNVRIKIPDIDRAKMPLSQ